MSQSQGCDFTLFPYRYIQTDTAGNESISVTDVWRSPLRSDSSLSVVPWLHHLFSWCAFSALARQQVQTPIQSLPSRPCFKWVFFPFPFHKALWCWGKIKFGKQSGDKRPEGFVVLVEWRVPLSAAGAFLQSGSKYSKSKENKKDKTLECHLSKRY